MVSRLLVPAFALGVLLLPNVAEAKCPVSESNPQQSVDFDKRQRLMPEADAELASAIRKLVREKVSSTATVHKALAVNNRSVATWYSCESKNCRGGVVYLNSNPDRLRIIQRGILPHTEEVGNRSGKAFRVLHTLVEDIDNDGDTELVVRYEIDGPRRPTTGIQTYEYMSIYNLPNLNLQLVFRLGQHGGGDFQEFCSYGVERHDFDCDRRTDLLIVQECGMNICFEEDAPQRDCKGQPKEKRWHLHWQKTGDIYAGKQGYGRVKAIADKKPFLVVAGEVAVASQQVIERAKALRGKLLAAGFDKTAIHDSREFRDLACCYQIVVVNRFADKDSAERLQKRLKEKGFEANVRRGF